MASTSRQGLSSAGNFLSPDAYARARPTERRSVRAKESFCQSNYVSLVDSTRCFNSIVKKWALSHAMRDPVCSRSSSSEEGLCANKLIRIAYGKGQDKT